jgi:hypothetical protein
MPDGSGELASGPVGSGLRERSGGGRGGRGGRPGGPRPGGWAGVAETARWFALRVFAALAAVLVMTLIAGFVLARQGSGPKAPWAKSTGRDGVWLGHSWVAGGGGDLGALTGRLRGSGIADVYVLAGRLDARGSLDPAAYPAARGFIAALHATLPSVRVFAVLAGNAGSAGLNLDDGGTRSQIVAAAVAARHAGFGGVQYELSPVASGDPGLLSLLSATRSALRSVPLSVVVPKIEPLPGFRLPASLLSGHPVFWDSSYLTAVAGRVSQVALLAFSTGMPFPSWYSGYVARETSLALRAVPASVGLVLGIPAYAASDSGHHGSAETVGAALDGIRVALTGSGHPRASLGVGMFGFESATGPDWASYRSGWVSP